MGDKTNITWTDKTWNPWYGCHKVSAGCKNCYFFRDAKRYGHDPTAIVRSKTTFSAPLKWKEPAKVFTCSWSDFFIEEADPWRNEAWDIIWNTPHLTYQILTKRPERIAQCLPRGWENGYPNVWLGVTTEDQEQANKRIPILLQIPAAIRWLSIEPLLGPISLGPWLHIFRQSYADNSSDWIKDLNDQPLIDWVVVGGESGPDYRSMNLDWAREIRDQCIAANVPFFYKQESGLRPGSNPTLDGQVWHQFPA